MPLECYLQDPYHSLARRTAAQQAVRSYRIRLLAFGAGLKITPCFLPDLDHGSAGLRYVP